MYETTKYYKPQWVTASPPSKEKIKEYEQQVKEMNKKNKDKRMTYYLNMTGGGNFICFGLRKRTWWDKIVDFLT